MYPVKINVLLFGQLSEITGTDRLEIESAPDTGSLLAKLNERFPALAETGFVVAVDRKVVSQNTLLSENCTVALMPPFSGG